MHEHDQSLLTAWNRMLCRVRSDPRELAWARERIRGFVESQKFAALRSWSLALRAGDTRIDDTGDGSVYLNRDVVSMLCSPVHIAAPGVLPAEAATLLGVSTVSIWRWSQPAGQCGGFREEDRALREVERRIESRDASALLPLAPSLDRHRTRDRKLPRWADPELRTHRRRTFGRLLVRDLYVNSADRKRDSVLVWTLPGCGIGPSGEVHAAPWSSARRSLTQQAPDDFEQTLQRVQAYSGRRRWQWHWVCPTCSTLCHKVFWPMPIWTLPAALGVDTGLARMEGQRGFACRSCSKLVYESSEAHWKPRDPAASRAVEWDRYVQRMSLGLLRGEEVGS